MAKKDFKVDDAVVWNSTQGEVTGSVKKKLTSPTDMAHKPAALKRVKAG